MAGVGMEFPGPRVGDGNNGVVALGALPQFLLGALAFRDIAHDAEQLGLAVDFNPADAVFHREGRAVLAPMDGFVNHALRRVDPLEEFRREARPAIRPQVRDRHPEQLFPAPAIRVHHLLVDVDQLRFLVAHEDHVLGMPHHQAEAHGHPLLLQFGVEAVMQQVPLALPPQPAGGEAGDHQQPGHDAGDPDGGPPQGGIDFAGIQAAREQPGRIRDQSADAYDQHPAIVRALATRRQPPNRAGGESGGSFEITRVVPKGRSSSGVTPGAGR